MFISRLLITSSHGLNKGATARGGCDLPHRLHSTLDLLGCQLTYIIFTLSLHGWVQTFDLWQLRMQTQLSQFIRVYDRCAILYFIVLQRYKSWHLLLMVSIPSITTSSLFLLCSVLLDKFSNLWSFPLDAPDKGEKEMLNTFLQTRPCCYCAGPSETSRFALEARWFWSWWFFIFCVCQSLQMMPSLLKTWYNPPSV